MDNKELNNSEMNIIESDKLRQNLGLNNTPTPAEINTPTPAEINTPKATENKEPLSVLFIMDGSSSMESMGKEPLDGLNNLIKQQQETGDFRFTLIVFSDTHKIVLDNMNGKDIPVLTSDHYKPGGMTALYDAIGFGISLQKERKINNVLVVILTDGEENSSIIYSKKQVKQLTTKMTDEHKWVFMYLGANQDSFAVSKNIGINISANYEYTEDGCCRLFRGISNEIARCVSGETSTQNFKPELQICTDPPVLINEEEENNNTFDIKQSISMTNDQFNDFEILPPAPPSLGRTYSC